MNPRQDLADPIKHVILLMFENHSFDQMLGCFKDLYPELEGVDPKQPGRNRDRNGNEYRQEVTTERQMVLDPHHEVDHVKRQLENDNGGFVVDLQEAFPSTSASELAQQSRYIMGYYARGFLPALHTFAEHFTICDHWFSSLPGPTWPNRFFTLTGTSCGRVNMPDDGRHKLDLPGWFEQDQDTIFDRLSQAGISWKVYFDSIPQSCVLLHQRRPENAARYFPMEQFYLDSRGREEDFPPFSFIEPDYLGAHESDDHPPHVVMKAQKLMADVYNAIRSNQAIWKSTLLIVAYDEHGGFYDHVSPPSSIPPDEHHEEYTFDRLGVRVPAVLVSPWVKKTFSGKHFDHTSILCYMTEKWGLRPLGKRAQMANSIASLIERVGPSREDTPRWIELTRNQLEPPDPDKEEQAESYPSGHHKSLSYVFQYLKVEALQEIPQAYSAVGRLVVGFAHWLFAHSPEKLMRETAAVPAVQHREVKDHFMHYFRQQRRRAIPVLAATIRDETKDINIRHHAVETLSHITGRQLHKEPDALRSADRWLRRRQH